MALDLSIYGNIKQPEQPSLIDTAGKAMTLGQMALQNRRLQQADSDDQAMRSALSNNYGSDGRMNQAGVLSDLIQGGHGAQAMEFQGHVAAMNKASREDQDAQMMAHLKRASILGQSLETLAGKPDEVRAQLYPAMYKALSANGVIEPSQGISDQYNKDQFDTLVDRYRQSKEGIETRLKQSEIGKNEAEARLAPVKLNNELYGSRSPNATLTDQYTADVKPIRSSQMAMKQMLDNYNHPSPQGDASLVLNAFKIKFPTAPDVNSLKELGESQATIDQWKNLFNKSTKGGFDQDTRDNLMRDGVSTFRANTETLRDYQDKYRERARAQNVGDTSFLLEPGVDKTYAAAMKLQDKIGPYVPPTQREGGGIVGSIYKAISGGGNTAQAADSKTAPKQPGPGTGSVVMVGGRHYTVGPDGDTLIPVKAKK